MPAPLGAASYVVRKSDIKNRLTKYKRRGAFGAQLGFLFSLLPWPNKTPKPIPLSTTLLFFGQQRAGTLNPARLPTVSESRRRSPRCRGFSASRPQRVTLQAGPR